MRDGRLDWIDQRAIRNFKQSIENHRPTNEPTEQFLGAQLKRHNRQPPKMTELFIILYKYGTRINYYIAFPTKKGWMLRM
jgi:hypothetical protein